MSSEAKYKLCYRATGGTDLVSDRPATFSQSSRLSHRTLIPLLRAQIHHQPSSSLDNRGRSLNGSYSMNELINFSSLCSLILFVLWPWTPPPSSLAPLFLALRFNILCQDCRPDIPIVFVVQKEYIKRSRTVAKKMYCHERIRMHRSRASGAVQLLRYCSFSGLGWAQ